MESAALGREERKAIAVGLAGGLKGVEEEEGLISGEEAIGEEGADPSGDIFDWRRTVVFDCTLLPSSPLSVMFSGQFGIRSCTSEASNTRIM